MAPARGAEAEGPREAHGVPRDHQGRHPARASRTPARSTRRSSTRRRPAASSTGSTASRSRRCCGARSAPASRPDACSPPPPASSSTASASVSPSSRRRTGISSAPSAARGCRCPVHREARAPRRQARRPGGDFDDAGKLKADAITLDEAAAGALVDALRAPTASLRRAQARDQAVLAPSRGAVHHLDAAAGGVAQAALLRPHRR